MFKIIENKLATQGIHEFSHRELKDIDYDTGGITNITWPVADVRDLYDDDSNSIEDYEKKIDLAWELMQKYGRVVICCVAGISRSNAIKSSRFVDDRKESYISISCNTKTRFLDNKANNTKTTSYG